MPSLLISITQKHIHDPTLWVVSIALLLVIGANTLISVKIFGNYKWWYGLIKVFAYFGMFAFALSSGGLSAAIANVSTYLGMELNTLLRRLHELGIINGFIHAIGGSRKDKKGKVAAKR